ncbi:thioredoxin domain-containing protein [Paenibacillus illinoisensis]|uniref:DsbA family protein n=1 Tax=Paenibacillus illinoisensis TaxID=59845 RepID=UPI001C8D3256|nr:thioredoxin domain-containing protein [Paenibacillus illinoisensis]MBY0217764.1 thioredoxin domain-containing protein [Paenibacillus illinoisensis]
MMEVEKRRNSFKKWLVVFTFIGLLVVLLIVLLSGFNSKEEFPTFQDVDGKIEVMSGEYKLDKQAYIGDPQAPVKVIEFVDYKCPYCKAWNNENFENFKNKFIDTGKVQFYVINYPFLGPDSIKAAMVGEILWGQNHEAFWEYHHAIYQNQGEERTMWANENFLLKLIKDYVPHGNVKSVEESLKNLEGLYEVKEDFKITSINSVASVPTFVVDEKKYVNPSLEQLSEIIESLY